MPDPLAGQGGTDASADAPVLTAADIEKIKAEMTASFEERFKGMQRLVAERDDLLAARAAELEELKTAGLSDEEREQLEESKKDREIATLRSQLELQALAGEYGSEMPYFERLLKAPTAEDQLKAMREFAQSFAPKAPVTPAAGEPEIPEVDLNRPGRQPLDGVVLPDGTVMNDAIADQILASAGRGALRR